MRTAFLFLAAACVLFFAPWGTSTTNNWLAGILLAVFVLLAFVSHMTNVVRPDSEDMER